MSSDVEIRPCLGCGTPKRIDTACAATQECIDRNAAWRNGETRRFEWSEGLPLPPVPVGGED